MLNHDLIIWGGNDLGLVRFVVAAEELAEWVVHLASNAFQCLFAPMKLTNSCDGPAPPKIYSENAGCAGRHWCFCVVAS
jgi:hypothetical protein